MEKSEVTMSTMPVQSPLLFIERSVSPMIETMDTEMFPFRRAASHMSQESSDFEDVARAAPVFSRPIELGRIIPAEHLLHPVYNVSVSQPIDADQIRLGQDSHGQPLYLTNWTPQNDPHARQRSIQAQYDAANVLMAIPRSPSPVAASPNPSEEDNSPLRRTPRKVKATHYSSDDYSESDDGKPRKTRGRKAVKKESSSSPGKPKRSPKTTSPKTKPKDKVDPAEKAQTRRERNRDAARRSREKKGEYLKGLETENAALKDVVQRLERENMELRRKIGKK